MLRRICAWLLRLGCSRRAGMRRKWGTLFTVCTCSFILACAVWCAQHTAELPRTSAEVITYNVRKTLFEVNLHRSWYITRYLKHVTYRIKESKTMRRVLDIVWGPPKEFGPEDCPAETSKVAPCNNGSLLLIAYVYSSPRNIKYRRIIRRTWANTTYHGPEHVKTVFIIGKRKINPALKEALELEQQTYGDVFLGDFWDHYYTLTLKGLSALNWLHHCCKIPPFALKIDDDVFLNIFTLLDKLRAMKATNDTRDVIWCDLSEKAYVQRTGKYAVSFGEYAARMFPPFCFGPAYVYSTDIIPRLLGAAFETPALKLEDVYFTGILLKKLGINQRNNFAAYSRWNDTLQTFFLGEKAQRHIFSHTDDFQHYHVVWRRLIDLLRPNGLKS